MRRGVFVVVFAGMAAAACGDDGGRPGTAGRIGEDGGADSGGGRPVSVRCEETTDADGDGIYDELEGTGDLDQDGTPNHLDDDSDGDGLLDADERGGETGCAARDTDSDALWDFLDNDSDNDGLSDDEETSRYFTDPYDDDTDGDGFTDLGEVVTHHDPNDANDGLEERDFFVVLPYEASPEVRELRFGTRLRKADVFFMMDRTGSMTGEVANLRHGLAALVERITATIPDIGVGFGGYEDFDVETDECLSFGGIPMCARYGGQGDVPFELVSVIETDPPAMLTAVDRLEADGTGATWASTTEALYQAATGEGIRPWVPPQSCPTLLDEPATRYGYPCFRPGALPILVVMTDTSSRNGPGTTAAQDYEPRHFPADPPHTFEQTRRAVLGIGARVLGVISGNEVATPAALSQAEEWARVTGTVDASGAPIAFSISGDGSGLTGRVADAIEQLAGETPQDISTRTEDGTDFPERAPGVDATGFIKSITPTRAINGSGQEIPPSDIARDDRSFYGVPPGITVAFDVTFLNDFVPPEPRAQVFQARIIVTGNGVADLDARDVLVVVPAGQGPLL